MEYFHKPTPTAQHWLRQLLRIRNIKLVHAIEQSYALTNEQKSDLMKAATNMDRITKALAPALQDR